MYEKQLVKDDVLYDQYTAEQTYEAPEETEEHKRERARAFYSAMMDNYTLFKRGRVGDRKAYVDMINAAIGLGRLNLPNPFEKPVHTINAATRPGKGRVVTAVTEESV